MSNLDLHGIKHIDVEWTVENWIGQNTPPYEIITGNSKRMQSIVLNILDRHDMKYIIWTHNSGSICVL